MTPTDLSIVREELTEITVEEGGQPTGGTGERIVTTQASFTGKEELETLNVWNGTAEVSSRAPAGRTASMKVEAPLIADANRLQIAQSLQMPALYDDPGVVESTAIEVVQMTHVDGTQGGYRLKGPQVDFDKWRLYENLPDGAVELPFYAQGFPDAENNGWRVIKAFELVGSDVYVDIDEQYTMSPAGEFGGVMVPQASNGNVRLRIGDLNGWNHPPDNGRRYNVEGRHAADQDIFQVLERVALTKAAFAVDGKAAAKWNLDFAVGDWQEPTLSSARSGSDAAPIHRSQQAHINGRRVEWFVLGGGELVFTKRDFASSVSKVGIDFDWMNDQIGGQLGMAGTMQSVGKIDAKITFTTYTYSATELALASPATRITVRSDGSVSQGVPLDLIFQGLAGDFHVFRVPSTVITSRPTAIGANNPFEGGATPGRRQVGGGSVFYSYFRPMPPLS